MIRSAALAATAILGLAACDPVPPGATVEGNVPLESYYMVGIGADAVPERNMAVRFTENQIIGSGPCNSFTATNAARLPAIQITNFVPTTAPCREAWPSGASSPRCSRRPAPIIRVACCW